MTPEQRAWKDALAQSRLRGLTPAETRALFAALLKEYSR